MSQPAKAVSATSPRPPFKVKDLALAELGRKEIRLAEQEMPGLMALRARHAGARPLAGARIMQAIDNAPDLRSSVLKSLEGADDGVLASMRPLTATSSCCTMRSSTGPPTAPARFASARSPSCGRSMRAAASRLPTAHIRGAAAASAFPPSTSCWPRIPASRSTSR